ncbi:similar to Saccharomyces cerevisiae YDR055W PST1 Cell wall protein that contains a putative GPI-attachment site [Maudiozyma saulgeensis]|uniref:Similar to Saccharomyces cerevisiae YDR055W PST1 Cell wall protein that contains a putative GPI-attachment site n=1 Tax=Maudiozyma saulgeensis TaxID=1789683 RepID=A0A1X7R485_9SACH|nr:similar to Saccharomyces cerevisiae YDR055W PST1 Cell wall protein that contains a putative GPI-attachment site [Kazachstania saulgeensis]
MQFKSFSIAALLATSALAADSSSSSSSTKTSSTSIPSGCSLGSSATATAQSDLDEYSGCTTLVGNLTISGVLGSGAIANVQKIDGSLRIYNATDLVTFSADSIEEITGSLELQSLTVLTTASFGALEKVGTISLITLPAISTFATNLKSASNILISDTSLESIDGFSALKTVDSFNINNNRYLTSVKASLSTVSNALELGFNGQNTALSFDELIWANNITLSSVSNVSFAKLQKVNASMGFINNTFTDLTVDELESVGQTFTISSNDDLENVSFQNLTTIGGGFVIANNTNLKTIDTFSEVTTIGGALNVIGNFTTLDLSSLKSVKGGADIETSASNFSCDALKKLQSKGAIQGDNFVCKNGAVSSSASSSVSSSASSTKSGSSKSSSASSDDSSDSSSSSSSSSKSSGAAGIAYTIPQASLFGLFATVLSALL